jgi:hypothetical protein
MVKTLSGKTSSSSYTCSEKAHRRLKKYSAHTSMYLLKRPDITETIFKSWVDYG